MVPTKHGTIRISSLAFIPYIVVVALGISQEVHCCQLEADNSFFLINLFVALIYLFNRENGIVVMLNFIIVPSEHFRRVAKHLSRYQRTPVVIVVEALGWNVSLTIIHLNTNATISGSSTKRLLERNIALGGVLSSRSPTNAKTGDGPKRAVNLNLG